MARKKYKNETIVPVTLYLNKGLNYSQSAANIDDNELTRSTNIIYDPETDKPVTRLGTDCVTADTCDGINPILKIHPYLKDASNSWLVGACNGNLYYLDDDAWVLIGALNDGTTVPSFLTFNTKCLVADGGADIKTWDGTTYGTIADSPQASCLAEAGNRVIANATDEPDSVYLSGPEDQTDWDTVSGNAIGLKVGYGDGLNVNGFAVKGDDIIVSKIGLGGKGGKKIYRINISDPTPANWKSELLSSNNAFQSAHTSVQAFNDVFFADDNGFKSLRGVQEYGDLAIDPTGRKINQVWSSGDCDEVAYLPKYNAIWISIASRVFCYYHWNQGFTDLFFAQGRIRSMCQYNDNIYLAGHNGYLYKIGTAATDETEPSTTTAITGVIKTKTFTATGDLLLKRLRILFSPKATGTAKVYIVKPGDIETLVKEVDLQAEGDDLYDATGYIYDATGYLYDSGSAPWFESCYSIARADEIAFKIVSTSGRMCIEHIKADFAVVGR